ncbi:DNA-packaging protein [Candidatus Nanosynbacter sp. TM7-087]|uniref:DNA-packaging protein n=1 Tax=Candidatus Nanosynbacter sp. TM7-087 TaxID=2902631 RepID=UPI001FB6E370|nr:DNA-packaging protein [Candidatus Nanosynbacter sp. TM7-087]MCJ1966341.1 DNA-packaging protein [Candidatus Nanosynbacter sp. TM7-087]
MMAMTQKNNKVAIEAHAQRIVDVVVRKAEPAPEPPKPVYEYSPGRPMKFQDIDELRAMILEYFKNAAPHWEEQTEYIDRRDPKSGKIVIENGRVVQDKVIRKVKTKQKPLTVTGLAVALGTSRDVLLDYETTYSEKYPEFSNTIKEAKEQIKAYAEESLFGTNTAGVIFSLKNNWGFKDKYETENTNREVKFINTVPRTPES